MAELKLQKSNFPARHGSTETQDEGHQRTSYPPSVSSALRPSWPSATLSRPFCHRQSLHSATWPRRKSLQGQRRLYLGENPAQLKSRGSRWRPHSRPSTENAGRMWLISESIMSHCTSNLRDGTEEQRSERSHQIKHLTRGILQRVQTNREQKRNFF